MLVIMFYYIYKQIYTCSIYQERMKKIEGHFPYSVQPTHPIPSHSTRKPALCAHRVNMEQSFLGSGKDNVGKCLSINSTFKFIATVRASQATTHTRVA